MCGFSGFIKGSHTNYDAHDVITEMSEAIKHRGPDASGEYIDDCIAIGFRRLKIIDLTENANQPFFNEKGNLVLVFNGEIYNYQELKKELELLGYEFKSETDSEVVIHGYDAWGKEVLDRLRGMFAFVVWNKEDETLFMARDIFGIKPLYYGEASDDHTFFFGSEIKSFLKHPSFRKELNSRVLKPYLSFQSPVTDETFFADIYKLPPASWMLIDHGAISRGTYWQFDFDDYGNQTLEEYITAIDETLRDSVKAHQVSDVPVGAFLSGGIDSSYVTSIFNPQDTFSVGFAEGAGEFNETDLAKRLSEIKGFTHHQKLITADEFFAVLPTIQYHMDEPQSNLSSVPLYFLAELASQHVKVVLSGEGADELFGGYDEYVDTPRLSIYKHLPHGLRRGLYQLSKHLPKNRLTDLFRRGGQKPEEYFIGEAKIFTDEEATDILKAPYASGLSTTSITQPVYRRYSDKSDLTKKQLIDLLIWMPGDILLKADKMSSAHSLELRVPFLDKKMMRVAESIPPKYRVHEQISKYALRLAALKELPNEWAERPKKGFPVPIRFWLQQRKYAEPIRAMFSSATAEEFFDVPQLLKLLDDHIAGVAKNQRKIYTVYSFLLWYDEYFVKR